MVDRSPALAWVLACAFLALIAIGLCAFGWALVASAAGMIVWLH